MDQMAGFETARLLLRQWRASDIDPFHAVYADPASEAIHGKTSRPEVWRQVALFIGHFQLCGHGLWALEDRASGAFACYAGLGIPQGRPGIEVGHGIVPALRRKGLAAEAARFARGHGHRQLGMNRLVSYIQPGNAASIGIADRLGAKPDGVLKMAGKPHSIYARQNSVHEG
jgi:RimJ/RimL family protein N-acetyltransferase